MKVVLDTNVLVSGLLSPSGPPGRVIDLLVMGAITAVYDDRVLAEYREVLARPRLRIQPAEATAVLDLVVAEGILAPSPPLPLVLPDPDDLPFLEVAVSGDAAALVTGNERHFRPLKGEHFVRVLSPAAFVALWRETH